MGSARRDKRAFVKQLIGATVALSLGGARSTPASAEERPAKKIDTGALFTPFAIGPFTTRNRFVMAPMSVGEFTDGVPTTQVVDHYEARAKGGVGLLVTGGTIVDHPYGSADDDVGRMTAGSAEGWKRVTERVHAHRAGIFCQLWHQGPLTRPGIGPQRIVEQGRTVVAEASRSDLASVVDAFVRSARLARNSGFDGIEIHGAHGYLLDAYLRAYGAHETASSEVTAETFVYLLVREVRAAVGAGFPIGLRFSRWSNSGDSPGYLADPSSLERTLLPLRRAGVDVFHASRGYGPYWPPEYRGSPLTLAGWCRHIVGVPTIAVGHVGLDPARFFGRQAGGLATLMAQFAEHQFDLIAVGRALLKNPEWVAMVEHKAYAELIAAGPAD